MKNHGLYFISLNRQIIVILIARSSVRSTDHLHANIRGSKSLPGWNSVQISSKALYSNSSLELRYISDPICLILPTGKTLKEINLGLAMAKAVDPSVLTTHLQTMLSVLCSLLVYNEEVHYPIDTNNWDIQEAANCPKIH